MLIYTEYSVCTEKKELIQIVFGKFLPCSISFIGTSVYHFSAQKNPSSFSQFFLPRLQALNQLTFLKSSEDVLKYFNLFSFNYLLYFLLFCASVSQSFLPLPPYPTTPFCFPLSTSVIVSIATKQIFFCWQIFF